LKEGVLTPEEFAQAGDNLVYKCPTWSWGAGKPDRVVKFFPKEKQYLITKDVPCLQRVSNLERSVNASQSIEIDVEGDDEQWVQTNAETPANSTSATKKNAKEEIPDLDDDDENNNKKNDSDGEEDNSDEDIPDFEDFNGDNLEDDDECALREDAKASNGGEEDGDYVVKTRTYDICITYDNYTSTPRVWLYGYDENHKPLKQEDMFHDISQDHAKKKQ